MALALSSSPPALRSLPAWTAAVSRYKVHYTVPSGWACLYHQDDHLTTTTTNTANRRHKAVAAFAVSKTNNADDCSGRSVGRVGAAQRNTEHCLSAWLDGPRSSSAGLPWRVGVELVSSRLKHTNNGRIASRGHFGCCCYLVIPPAIRIASASLSADAPRARFQAGTVWPKTCAKPLKKGFALLCVKSVSDGPWPDRHPERRPASSTHVLGLRTHRADVETATGGCLVAGLHLHHTCCTYVSKISHQDKRLTIVLCMFLLRHCWRRRAASLLLAYYLL